MAKEKRDLASARSAPTPGPTSDLRVKLIATVRADQLEKLQSLALEVKTKDRNARATAAKAGLPTAGMRVRTLSSLVEGMLDKALPELEREIKAE